MSIGAVIATIGALLLAGLAVEWVGRSFSVPRVTLLMIFGFLIGPSALDLFPGAVEIWFEPVTQLALVMVGFLVGERFSMQRLRQHGLSVLVISIADVLGASVVTGLGLWLLGAPTPLALLLAAIAGATAPAATYDVVAEARADGTFTDTLLGIVAIDDAWGLLLFSLAIAVVGGILGAGMDIAMLGQAAKEIGGAIGLGIGLGVPAGLLTHRIDPGEPTVLEALGIMLLTAGVAVMLDVSYILTAMVLGVVMVNIGTHQDRAFHEIENLEWPFMVLFFILAGASLKPASLLDVGLLGAAYVVLRTCGKLAGSYLGAGIAAEPSSTRHWMGAALLPQAGVALGMALVATQRFPELRDTLLPLVIGSTVVFEVIGPVFTRLALRQAGEFTAIGGKRGQQ